MINTKKLKNYSIKFIFCLIMFSTHQFNCIGCEGPPEEQNILPSAHKQGGKPLNRQLDSSLSEHLSLNDSFENFKIPLNETITNDLLTIKICSEDIKGDLTTPITSYNDSPTVSGSRANIYFANESPKSETPTGQGSKRRVAAPEKRLTANNYSKAKEVSPSRNLLGSLCAADKGPLQVRVTVLCGSNEVHNDETNNNDQPKTLVANNENTKNNKQKK